MSCFMPFNSRNLEVSFMILRPMVVIVDDLVDALKHFSLYTESLGCVHSAILRSIHGSMLIWYGAWLKRSKDDKELLIETIQSVLTNISSMAILIDHSFFDAFAGESRNGSPAAKFCTGDIISMNAALLTADDANQNELSYAGLAIFKSQFTKMEGATSGVCLKCHSKPGMLCLFVWKFLHSCYSWILNSDYRTTVLPYVNHLALDVKYDIFKVVYVSGDNVLNQQFVPPPKMLQHGVGK